MNRITLTGRLGKDPETRHTSGNKKVSNFSLAVNDGYGEKKSTMWVRVTAWEKLADLVDQYLKKGSHVLVEGRLRIYESDEDKWYTEVVAQNIEFLDKKSDATSGAAPASNSSEITDDDIPF